MDDHIFNLNVQIMCAFFELELVFGHYFERHFVLINQMLELRSFHRLLDNVEFNLEVLANHIPNSN